MSVNSNKYLILRLILLGTSVCFAGIQGFTQKNLDQAVGESTGMSFPEFAFMLIGTAIGLLIVMWIQSINRYSAPQWDKPSWSNNPFNPKQPIQFFHMGAWLFMASGLSLFIFHFLRSNLFSNYSISLMTVGLGVWLGVRLSVLILKKKSMV
ncbi:MAG: hypothetical protein ACE14V_15390 [bacterium]